MSVGAVVVDGLGVGLVAVVEAAVVALGEADEAAGLADVTAVVVGEGAVDCDAAGAEAEQPVSTRTATKPVSRSGWGTRPR